MKKRIDWIDIAKGLAIVLMMVGHTIPYNHLNYFIFSFHMALFVILSGITYKIPKDKNELKVRIIKYVKRLAIPYVFVLFVCSCIKYVEAADKLSILSFLKQFIKNVLWGNACDYTLFGKNFIGVGPIWFLIALFFAKVLFDIINYKIDNKNVYTSIIIYCFFALLGVEIGKVVWLPQSLDLVFVFLLYLYIGFLFHKYYKKISKYKIQIFLICFLIWASCLGFNMYTELAIRSYPNGFLSVIESICASYCIIELCKIFERNNVLRFVFVKIGIISLTILCVHSIEYALGDWVYYLHVSVYLIAIIRVLAVLVVSFLVAYIKKWIIMLKDKIKEH